MLIVKCQRSQFSSDAERKMLIYDRRNDHHWESELTERWSALFDRYGERFFARVTWNPDAPPEFEAALSGDFDF